MILNNKKQNINNSRKTNIKASFSILLISLALFNARPCYSVENSTIKAQNINSDLDIKDLDKSHWAYSVISELIKKYNLKIGYPDNTFKGENKISRYEVAALLLQVLHKLNTEHIKIDYTDNLTIDNIRKEYSNDLENIKKSIEVLQDQTDISAVNIEKLDDEIELFNKALSFKLFGSIAFRNCFMTNNIITEPQNIFKNIRGNTLQTRIAGGINGTFIDNFSYQIRVLTADSNSYNLSWTPGIQDFTRIPFSFDRVFITYEPKFFNHNLKFTVGKSANFFPETELFFDEDVSFNGSSQQISFNDVTPWLNNIFIGLSENVMNHTDRFDSSFMLGGKVAAELEPVDKFKIKLGGSYTAFPGIAYPADRIYDQGYIGETSRLNQVNADKSLKSKFNLLDSFIKLSYEFSQNYPLEIYLDMVNNLGATDKNRGYIIGASLGAFKNPGDLFFNYNFKSLDQDYNLSFLVQDQMGGTDVMGHQFDFGVQVAAKTKVLFTLQNRTSLTYSPQNPSLYILYSTIRQDF